MTIHTCIEEFNSRHAIFADTVFATPTCDSLQTPQQTLLKQEKIFSIPVHDMSNLFKSRACKYLAILVDDLPVKVIQGHNVLVNNPKLAHTSSRQVESYR